LAHAEVKYVEILKINDGKTIEAGKSATLKFKFLEQTTDKSFNFILRDEEKKIFEKIGTVDDTKFPFNKGNTYDVNISIPEKIASGNYLVMAYVGEENKVSDSKSVKITGKGTEKDNKTSDNQNINNQNIPSNSTIQVSNSTIPVTNSTIPINNAANNTTTSTGSTSASQPNVATAGNASSSNNESKSFNLRNIIIIGSIIGVILVIFGLLFYCCIKDSKKGRNDSVWDLPPSVSEPHLVSSSTPINAIPLQYKNSGNQYMNRNQFTSPIMSPISHSNSNYSDVYQETRGLTESTRHNNDIQSPTQDYNRNTIYSDSLNSPQNEEVSSPSPSYYFQVFKPHQVYRVLYDFQPSLPDEMEVQPGDIIRTEETFEDGWAFGINVTTGKQGTFPMNCLEDDNATEGDSKSFISERSHSRRVSSLNPQNAKAIQMMLKNGGQSPNFQKSYYMSQINNMKV
jgi:hypothetical protein